MKDTDKNTTKRWMIDEPALVEAVPAGTLPLEVVVPNRRYEDDEW